MSRNIGTGGYIVLGIAAVVIGGAMDFVKVYWPIFPIGFGLYGVYWLYKKLSPKYARARLWNKARLLKESLEEKFSDGKITDQEHEELIAEAQNLGMTVEQLHATRREHYYEQVYPIIRTAQTTGYLSPQSIEEMKKTGEALGVNVTLPSELMVAKMRWQLENKDAFELEPIQSSMMLKAGEHCYLEAESKWAQSAIIRQNKGYVGGSLRFRVANGVSLGVGRALPVYEEFESLKEVGTGTLYVTNKRLYFQSNQKTVSIKLNTIENIGYYSDAIEVFKSSGKPSVFFLDAWAIDGVRMVMEGLDK